VNRFNDPVMSFTEHHQHKLENAGNKLTRYQHHKQFLQTCLDNNLIPKGLSLKFNLNLKTEKENLKELCMQHLAKASLNLVKEIHLSTKNE